MPQIIARSFIVPADHNLPAGFNAFSPKGIKGKNNKHTNSVHKLKDKLNRKDLKYCMVKFISVILANYKRKFTIFLSNDLHRVKIIPPSFFAEMVREHRISYNLYIWQKLFEFKHTADHMII